MDLAVAEDVLAKAQRRLARGENAEDVLAFVGRTLTNKLMHEPSAALRKARGAHQQELLTSARHLFSLNDGDSSKTTTEDNE